ncbi:MAG TPA: response regulator [Pseudomonadota bacterium]|nr:response regulator [Pseudomonadota bacterium]
MLISYYRHELHTSLNAIIGYSELLLEDAQSSGLTEVERGLGEILGACRALLEFAKELLGPSRLRELSTDELTQLTRQLYAAGQEPLAKVLSNCATLIAAAEQAGLYAIIPDLCKIQASGSMLQNLLEAHNSTLSASAVQSPRTTAEGEGEGGEPGAAAAGSEKILIIDDNSMNRDLLRQGLERRGYRVEEATGGRQGLEYIAEQTYDLVLLDLRMPDLGGIELLQALKEQGRLPQLPVVILSASEDPSDVASCFAHGALDYLVKPLNLAILGVRIRVYLERQRQHQRERQQLQELLHKDAARLPALP